MVMMQLGMVKKTKEASCHYSEAIFSHGPHMQGCCTISLCLAALAGSRRNYNHTVLREKIYSHQPWHIIEFPVNVQLLQFIQSADSNAGVWCMWCQCAFHSHAITQGSKSQHKVSSQMQGYGAMPLHVWLTAKYCITVYNLFLHTNLYIGKQNNLCHPYLKRVLSHSLIVLCNRLWLVTPRVCMTH